MLSLFLFFFLIRNSKGSFPLTSYPVHFFGKQSVTSREKLAKPQSPSQICFASTAANKLLPCFPCCVASLEIEEIFLSSPNQKLCFKHKYFALFFFFSCRLHNSSGFFGYFCCGSSLLLARWRSKLLEFSRCFASKLSVLCLPGCC